MRKPNSKIIITKTTILYCKKSLGISCVVGVEHIWLAPWWQLYGLGSNYALGGRVLQVETGSIM